MSNPFFGAVVVFDAAMSLARIFKQQGRPLMFDMDRYRENIIGGNPLAMSVLDRMDAALDYMESRTPEEKARIAVAIEDTLKLGRADRERRWHFVEALSDAFTMEEVGEIQPCALVEFGHMEFNGVEGNWYMIVAVPEPADVFVLDL